MKRKRRIHSSEFKARVALEAAREGRTLAGLAREYDVHANQVAAWKRQLLEGASGLFTRAAERDRDGEQDAKEMLAKFGELTMEREYLSRALKR